MQNSPISVTRKLYNTRLWSYCTTGNWQYWVPILVEKFPPLNAPLKAPLNILVIVLLMKFSKELSKEHSKEQNVCTRIGTLGFGTEVRYCMTVQTWNALHCSNKNAHATNWFLHDSGDCFLKCKCWRGDEVWGASHPLCVKSNWGECANVGCLIRSTGCVDLALRIYQWSDATAWDLRNLSLKVNPGQRFVAENCEN